VAEQDVGIGVQPSGAMMHWTYDRSDDVGYLYLTAIQPGGVKHTYVCDAPYIGGQVMLDFSEDGRLLGIEFLSTSGVLPLELLQQLRVADAAGERPIPEPS
jgi:uncharacterized protein YuzE